MKVISDRYFGGFPILLDDTERPLRDGELSLSLANEALKTWVKRLSRWPWQIDTASLEIDDPEIDDETVETIVEKMINVAKHSSRIDDPDAILGKE